MTTYHFVAASERFLTVEEPLEEVLKERTADLDIPRVFDLPVGHVQGNAALPLGRMASLDGDRGQLRLLL